MNLSTREKFNCCPKSHLYTFLLEVMFELKNSSLHPWDEIKVSKTSIRFVLIIHGI